MTELDANTEDKGRLGKVADGVGKFARGKVSSILGRNSKAEEHTIENQEILEPALEEHDIDDIAGDVDAENEQISEEDSVFTDTTDELSGEGKESQKEKKLDPYKVAIIEYNNTYTLMSDKGLELFRQRERSVDLIEYVRMLVNSIAKTPKDFETKIESISHKRAEFLESEELARQELELARESAFGAAAGLAAGAAVASLAPSAALWVATTFGTASTGTAIASLSGAAANGAALAWLGGGAVAVGGGGMASGSALLALTGPVGWAIGGTSLLVTISLYTHKQLKNRAVKQQALESVKKNTARLNSSAAQIESLLQQSTAFREKLAESYSNCLQFFGADYQSLTSDQQKQLATLVNNTTSCAFHLAERIEPNEEDE